MKKLIGLVIFLVVIVLGGYYGMGMMTERTLKKDISMINQSNGLKVEIKRYDRGWYTSNADLIWSIHIPERIVENDNGQPTVVPAQDYAVKMPIIIYHGPIIFSTDGVKFGMGYAKTELNLPEQFKKQFTESFADNSTTPKMNVSILVNYLNRTRLRIQVPQFTLISKEDGGQFKWLGMTSDVTATSRMEHVDGDFIIEGIQVTKDKMDAVISKMSSEYKIYQADNGMYLGEGSFKLPSIAVTADDKKLFELTQFNFESKSDIDNKLFHSSLDVSLQHLYANGESYGPGELSLAIKNLDADALARINEQVGNLQDANEQARQQLMFAMLPELPKLLGKGAEFEVSKLYMVMPDGKVQGSLSIHLPEEELTNPFQLVQKIQGEGQLQMPEKIIQKLLKERAKLRLMAQPKLQDALAKQMQENAVSTSAQEPSATQDSKPAVTKETTLAELDQKAQTEANKNLTAIVNAGGLMKEGDTYVIKLKLFDGQLTINGKPFNPAMIQF